jgi:hypothetical protein
MRIRINFEEIPPFREEAGRLETNRFIGSAALGATRPFYCGIVGVDRGAAIATEDAVLRNIGPDSAAT